jgi:hypothetical protein
MVFFYFSHFSNAMYEMKLDSVTCILFPVTFDFTDLQER